MGGVDVAERLRQGFVDRRDRFGLQARYAQYPVGHWDLLLGSQRALDQKLERCRYMGGFLGNGRILDFGSGLGFLSCYLARQVEAVVGVEVMPISREISRLLAEIFEVENVRFVEQIPQERFSAVVLSNVITHVRPTIETLIVLRDTLEVGGVIYIEDNNNWNSPLVRRDRMREWRQVETAFERARAERYGQPLARETYGLAWSEIERWKDRDRAELRPLRARAPYDPTLEMYHENAFRPQELATILFNLGFAVQEVRPKHVFDFRVNRPVSWVFRSFPRLSLRISPGYEVLAVKI